jgi:hypothetical protein
MGRRQWALCGLGALLLSLLPATICAQAAATANFVTVPYRIPPFAMKLIVVEGDGFSINDFQAALDQVVRDHLEKTFVAHLPTELSVICQSTFDEVELESVVEHTPIELEVSDGIPVGVVRAAFEGIGKFNITKELAHSAKISMNSTKVRNSTVLLEYVGYAFDKFYGFWDLAATITNDTVLSRAGKLQIAVDGVIVAEGSLINEEGEEEEEGALTVAAMVTIGAIVALFLVVFGLGLLYYNHKRMEAELERKKLERREQARRMRRKVASDNESKQNDDSNQGSSGSSGMDVEAAWMDDKARQVSTVPDRLAIKNAQLKSQPKPRLRSRPALEAKKTSDSLLHCIAEESSHSDDGDGASVDDNFESLKSPLQKSEHSDISGSPRRPGSTESRAHARTASRGNASIAQQPLTYKTSSSSRPGLLTPLTAASSTNRQKQDSFDILGMLGVSNKQSTAMNWPRDEKNRDTLNLHDLGDRYSSMNDSSDRVIT